MNRRALWAYLLAATPLTVAGPETTMRPRIALAAWQFMDTMGELNQDRISTFLETLECHYDPQGICD